MAPAVESNFVYTSSLRIFERALDEAPAQLMAMHEVAAVPAPLTPKVAVRGDRDHDKERAGTNSGRVYARHGVARPQRPVLGIDDGAPETGMVPDEYAHLPSNRVPNHVHEIAGHRVSSTNKRLADDLGAVIAIQAT